VLSAPTARKMPDYHAIRFGGTLDVGRLNEFKVTFDVVPPSMPTLVDLTRVEAVDSVFLSELLLFRRRHRAKVAVVIPDHGNLTRVFALADMGRKVNVHTDLAGALADLGVGETRQTDEPLV